MYRPHRDAEKEQPQSGWRGWLSRAGKKSLPTDPSRAVRGPNGDTIPLVPVNRIWLHLERDWIVVLAVGLYAAGSLSLLFPFSETGRTQAEFLIGLAFNLLAVFAAWQGLRRFQPRERQFWGLIGVAFLFWSVAYVVFLVIPDERRLLGFDVVNDSIYLGFYLAFLFAVEIRPDLPTAGIGREIGRRFRFPGVVVFAAGLFVYFVLIPSAADPDLYLSWWPSFVFYLAVDVYLTGRLLLLAQATGSLRWRFCYRVLAMAWVLFALSDGAEWLVLHGVIPGEFKLPLAALWMAPSVFAVAAIRLRTLPTEDEETETMKSEDRGSVESGAPFFAYVLILPLLHFVVYGAGRFGESTEKAHELFLLVWLVFMGAVSLVQHLRVLEHTKELEGERRVSEERLWYLANYDSVTDLPNRAYFEERLERALTRARRGRRMMAVVFIDLDDFKRVNDTFGHAVGDELLRAVGRRLTRAVRAGDTVARFGGDEFTVILEGFDGVEKADRMLQRIGSVLAEPFSAGEQQVIIRASIGVGVYPQDGEDSESLLGNADAAMYQGKKSKDADQASIQFFTEEIHGEIRDRLRYENELREALRDEDLILHYQPKWSISGLRMTGVEALIRWPHPQRGLLEPPDFLALAESTGMMRQIDHWVLESACRQAAEWRRAGLAPFGIAVNLSAAEFRDPDLPLRVQNLLARLGLTPDALELELTETAVMADRGGVEHNIEILSGLGISVAIDDFGTGHNSLQFLTYLVPQSLKIAPAFIRNLEANPRATAVVLAILTLARELDIRVIAEGVETETQRALLEELGCDEIQGFLTGRPQSVGDLTSLLERERGVG